MAQSTTVNSNRMLYGWVDIGIDAIYRVGCAVLARVSPAYAARRREYLRQRWPLVPEQTEEQLAFLDQVLNEADGARAAGSEVPTTSDV